MIDPAPPSPESPPVASVTERHLAMLDRLADAALRISLALEAQIAGGPAVFEGDVVMAFDRGAGHAPDPDATDQARGSETGR